MISMAMCMSMKYDMDMYMEILYGGRAPNVHVHAQAQSFLFNQERGHQRGVWSMGRPPDTHDRYFILF